MTVARVAGTFNIHAKVLDQSGFTTLPSSFTPRPWSAATGTGKFLKKLPLITKEKFFNIMAMAH
jgi:hypothetical protein